MEALGRGLFLAAVAAACLFLPVEAEAYIGPGVGVTAIGTVIALVGAIVFAIVGFIWYPIKRLLATLRNRQADREAPKASVS
jgi:uncharacterized membrane protein YvlD (DUF360 family)